MKPLKQEDIVSMLKGSKKSDDVSLDLSYLDELSDGDDEFRKEMIQVFLREVPEQIKSLNTSVSDKNYDQTASIIHALRTKIRTFGIIALDELSERLEYSAKTKSLNNWKDFEKEVQNLTSELTKTALKLEQML
ncbi:MAG: Hpt domain-containing protein [Balneola sp.]